MTQVHKQLWVLASPDRSPSRHKDDLLPVSHHLPPLHKDFKFFFPLRLEDITAAGDNEFHIEYSLECLLRHGHLRAADVSKLLQYLRTLLQWEVIGSYSQELDALVKELPAVHRCNDGTIALAKVWVRDLYWGCDVFTCGCLSRYFL